MGRVKLFEGIPAFGCWRSPRTSRRVESGGGRSDVVRDGWLEPKRSAFDPPVVHNITAEILDVLDF